MLVGATACVLIRRRPWPRKTRKGTKKVKRLSRAVAGTRRKDLNDGIRGRHGTAEDNSIEVNRIKVPHDDTKVAVFQLENEVLSALLRSRVHEKSGRKTTADFTDRADEDDLDPRHPRLYSLILHS